MWRLSKLNGLDSELEPKMVHTNDFAIALLLFLRVPSYARCLSVVVF